MDHHGLQCDDGHEPARGAPVGGTGRESKAFPVLMTGGFLDANVGTRAWLQGATRGAESRHF